MAFKFHPLAKILEAQQRQTNPAAPDIPAEPFADPLNAGAWLNHSLPILTASGFVMVVCVVIAGGSDPGRGEIRHV